MIYFDHNATTPVDERVVESMLPFLSSCYGNPSSLYRAGRMTRSAIESARVQVAALVSAQPSQVIFTSGGTEANNLAIKGLRPIRIAISSFEHPSILDTSIALRVRNRVVDLIEVTSEGFISPQSFERVCAQDPELISVMLANNETGAIQEIASLSSMTCRKKTVFHTDAVQALGKIPVDFNQLGVQLMTVSSHKIYGPKGCGALIIDRKLGLEALVSGGGQENGLRAGTENVAAIVGFGKAAELAMSRLDDYPKNLQSLRQRLEAGLETIPGLVIFCNDGNRLANTVQFGVSGVDGEMLLMQLDRKGIAVSSGSACASGGGKPSHVLMSMGLDAAVAKSAIRISLGISNTAKEVDDFISTLKSLISPSSL